MSGFTADKVATPEEPMTRPHTEAEFILFRDAMCAAFGAKVVNKRDAIEHHGVALVLQARGILDADAYLDNYATTLGTVIAWPEGNTSVSLLAHELRHVQHYSHTGLTAFELALDAARKLVLQQRFAALLARFPTAQSTIDLDGLAEFAWRYVTDPLERGLFELDAYMVQAEVVLATTGRVWTLAETMSHLEHGYGLEAQNLADVRLVAESRLSELNATRLLRTTMARKAVEVLRGISPELVA